MSPKKHKPLLILISCVLLIAVGFTVFAVNNQKKPESVSGKFENLTADRIEIMLENTEFKLKKTSDSAEEYTISFFFSAKKTQGDFYALINSFKISDIAFDNIVFTALTDAAEGKTLDKLKLTATDGEPDLFRWRVDLTLSIAGKGEYNPVIMIDYTTGMTENSAQRKFIEIPVTITVE